MQTSFLPFSPPWLGEEEINEVVDTLHSDWITIGPKVKRFEREFTDFIGATAYGVKHPLMGQVVHARVSLVESEDASALTERLRKFCLERLTRFKIPNSDRAVKSILGLSTYAELPAEAARRICVLLR